MPDGHEEVVRVLLEAGAYVEDHNENGRTPLMEAASAGHVQVTKILFEHGADINIYTNKLKESALTIASHKGHSEMVRFLLKAGADQVDIGTCKSIKNFTSALKNLELETIDRDPLELRTSDAQTDYFNDSEQEDNVPVFKSGEISTFQLVIQGMEILNFHTGYEAFPRGDRALLEEGFSNVAVEISETCEKNKKN